MTLYLKYKIKSFLTDKSSLTWGLAFMEFWVVMWVYVFTPEKPELSWNYRLEDYLKVNSAIAYGYLGTLSMSSVAVGLASHVIVTSAAVTYATKFTKLSPKKYLLEDFVASVVGISAYALAIILSMVALTFARFKVIVVPDNPAAVLAEVILGGAILYWLGKLVALASLALGRARFQLLSMVPLFTGFVVYSSLWIDPGVYVYFIPLGPLPSLIISSSTGLKPATGGWLRDWRSWVNPSSVIDPALGFASLLVWVVLLVLASLALLKKARSAPIEEVALTQ